MKLKPGFIEHTEFSLRDSHYHPLTGFQQYWVLHMLLCSSINPSTVRLRITAVYEWEAGYSQWVAVSVQATESGNPEIYHNSDTPPLTMSRPLLELMYEGITQCYIYLNVQWWHNFSTAAKLTTDVDEYCFAQGKSRGESGLVTCWCQFFSTQLYFLMPSRIWQMFWDKFGFILLER